MSGCKTRPHILFIHPDAYALGGAEQVCVRMMAAAQRLGDVTLVHCGGALDCERLWKWFRVALDPTHVKFITAGSGGSFLGRVHRKPIMKYALALRYSRRITSEFDLVVGSYGECPIPAKRGIQYINVPIFSAVPEFLQYLNIAHDGPLQSWLRPCYVRVSRRLSGWDHNEIRRKRTLVNSEWTADVVRRLYGVSSLVASPAIEVGMRPDEPGWVDWHNRESGFVMLGRIHPSKRIELGIEIIQRVRSRGHQVQLHIAGRGADHYVKQLARSVEGMPHVHLHLDLPRPQLEQLIVRQKFGLHACEYEHYGIASAEMQALGCIVFAPDFAGQREVIQNPEQRYAGIEDAVEKICKSLHNSDLCANLSAETARRINCEHAQGFEDRVGAIFENELAK